MSDSTYGVGLPRVRYEAGITRTTVPSWSVSRYMGVNVGTFTHVDNGPALCGYTGETRRTNDVVTRNFSRIIAAGGIINNPFTSLHVKCTSGGQGQATTYNGAWVAGGSHGIDVTSILLKNDSRYQLGDIVGPNGLLIEQYITGIDWTSLLREAKTSALSKVDRNLASGLVGLGELKSTIESLLHPLSSIRDFITKWQSRRKGRRDGPLADRELTRALANDYLQLYYGLLPFCRDVESYIDAYVNSGAQSERTTVRGGSSDSYTGVDNVPHATPTSGTSVYSHRFTRIVSAEVRAGILHELPPLTWQKVWGVRYSDFFDAAYQLTPWSFFLDYFSNLGKLIGALTPRPGVRYLASWTTSRFTVTDRAECTGGTAGGGYSWTRANTEWAERTLKACIRTPEQVYDNVGLSLKLGNWNTGKALAVLSLAIQRLAA